jgi:hypothetical protein
MATYGGGIYENETALDYIYDKIHGFHNKLQDWVKDPTNFEADEPGIEMFFVDLDIYTDLLEKIDFYPPEIEEVQSWKQLCFSIWEDDIKSFPTDPLYIKNRRDSMNKAFNRLTEYCENYKY